MGGGGGGGLGSGGSGAAMTTLYTVNEGDAFRVFVGAGGAGVGGPGGAGVSSPTSPVPCCCPSVSPCLTMCNASQWGGSGGGATTVWSALVGDSVLVAGGGGGGGASGDVRNTPCDGGRAGLYDAPPVACGQPGATGGSRYSAGVAAGTGSTSTAMYAGTGGAGPNGGAGWAWTTQLPVAYGYGAGGPGGADAASGATAATCLSPRFGGAAGPSGDTFITPRSAGSYGGGGGGGGGYYGGGGGSFNGFAGTAGAGGSSLSNNPNAFTTITLAGNGGPPFGNGGDGYASIQCVAHPPPSSSPVPTFDPNAGSGTAGASPAIVGVAVAVPIAAVLLLVLGGSLWAGGPRALAAKIAGDKFKPVDGSTKAARIAVASGENLVSVAMTREEAAALGVMTMAAPTASAKNFIKKVSKSNVLKDAGAPPPTVMNFGPARGGAKSLAALEAELTPQRTAYAPQTVGGKKARGGRGGEEDSPPPPPDED